MQRLLSNRNVLQAKFNPAEFDGAWLASIGKPELRGSWIVFGKSGSGKTTFALMLCKYLSSFVKVMYNSLEQGLSLSMQMAWKRCDMQQAGNRIVFAPGEQLADVRKRLLKGKSPDVVLFDSITAMSGFNKKDYEDLIKRFPLKLFIFIAHKKNNAPYPAVAEHIRKLSEVKIHVCGYKGMVTTRYEADGCGGEDFIIWKQGANEYAANL